MSSIISTWTTLDGCNTQISSLLISRLPEVSVCYHMLTDVGDDVFDYFNVL